MDSLALESGLSPTTVLPRMERRERESLPLRLIQCVILDQHLTSHQRAKSNINQKPVSGFPYSSVGKESTCNAGDSSSITGSGRSTGEGIGYPLQYSAVWETWVQSLGWEHPWEKGKATHSNILAWRIHGVTKSRTQLSDFHFPIIRVLFLL